MNNSNQPDIPAIAILYHKQSTSAMTRFFAMPHGVTLGQPLADDAIVSNKAMLDNAVEAHPAAIAATLEQWFNLPAGSLSIESGYRAWVNDAEAQQRVYLMRFTTMDPPFDEAEAIGGSFFTLTQARGLPASQLALLRLAYVLIMEG